MTEERVRRVELAEAFLKQLTGLQELRVRHEADEVARVEVAVRDFGQLAEPATCVPLVEELKRLGFRRVTLDLEGFRSGSLNDALPLVTLGAKVH